MQALNAGSQPMLRSHRPARAFSAALSSGRARTRIYQAGKDGKRTGLLEQLGELGPIGLTVGPDARKVRPWPAQARARC